MPANWRSLRHATSRPVSRGDSDERAVAGRSDVCSSRARSAAGDEWHRRNHRSRRRWWPIAARSGGPRRAGMQAAAAQAGLTHVTATYFDPSPAAAGWTPLRAARGRSPVGRHRRRARQPASPSRIVSPRDRLSGALGSMARGALSAGNDRDKRNLHRHTRLSYGFVIRGLPRAWACPARRDTCRSCNPSGGHDVCDFTARF